MEIKSYRLYTVVIGIVVAMLFMPIAHAALLSSTSTGFGGQTRSDNYDSLVSAMCSNTAVMTTIGNKLWVPWYTTSTSCTTNDLQKGNNCNSGETIDATHNCMVSDEFSQVGVLLAMSKDQTKMNQFYNTVLAMKSSYGQLPAWRIYRSGSTIEACRPGINGNCDTASDATSRIIVALFTAAKNLYFTDQAQKAAYNTLAITLSKDFLNYEVVNSCQASNQGSGNICWWLASGSGAKSGGMASADFAYTGYYGDAIDAMLMACSATNDPKYCAVAGNFTLNYLQAANFDGNTFTAPPGKSFKWTTASSGSVPVAVCTSNCGPTQWDTADAPRALGICQANYYAGQIGVTLPRLQAYCNLWGSRYYTSATSAPVQFTPSGASVNGNQAGFFIQGLEALYQSGGFNQALFGPTLDSALGHYSQASKTWDNTACFGVYAQSFAVRALGFGIGRDAAAFMPTVFGRGTTSAVSLGQNTPTTSITSPIACANRLNDLSVTCSGGTITQDVTSGCRTVLCTNGGDSMQVLACDKSISGAGTYYEVYKQKQTGTKVAQICIGQACIGNTGFASSTYLACTTQISSATNTMMTGSTPSTVTNTVTSAPSSSVVVSIAPWFPQGRNYVFKCDAAGFTPTSYDWNFGDGQTQPGATRNDVYHSYIAGGKYALSCTARNGQTSQIGTLTVSV